MDSKIKETEVKTYDGGVDEAQISKWKKQYGKVIRIDVVDDCDTHIGYFKRPSMETIQASAKIGKSDDFKAGRVLFDGTWLGGSEMLGTDGIIYVACMAQLNRAFNNCMTSLKNL